MGSGDISKIPFTVYDFFAYLFAGSVVMSAVDYLYGYQWLLQKEPRVIFVIFLLGLAYVTGISAAFPAWCETTRDCRIIPACKGA